MMAQNELTGSNVIIQFENLAANPEAAALSETEYLEILKEQMESLDEMDYSFDDPYSVTIAGGEYTGINAHVSNLDLDQYFYIRKQNGYMVAIIISLVDETPIEEVMKHFSSM